MNQAYEFHIRRSFVTDKTNEWVLIILVIYTFDSCSDLIQKFVDLDHVPPDFPDKKGKLIAIGYELLKLQS